MYGYMLNKKGKRIVYERKQFIRFTTGIVEIKCVYLSIHESL